MLDKSQVRHRVQTLFQQYSHAELHRESIRLCQKLKNRLPEEGLVMGYLSLQDEVDLQPLFDIVNISWVVPGMKNSEIVPVRFSMSQREGEFGVREPIDAREVPLSKIKGVIVPGRAFTIEGKRIGRGGSHYDQFLSKLSDDVIKIGVCFEFQLFEDLPQEEHDVLMDQVIY